MAWLDKLRPGRAATQEGHPNPQGAVEHVSWERMGGAGPIREDMFINPDMASPVAAVIVARIGVEGAHHLSMEAVPRMSMGAALDAGLEKHGLSLGGMAFSLPRPAAEALATHGIAHASHAKALIAHAGTLEERRDYLVERGRTVMEALKNSDLISTNPAVRAAMTDTMTSTLISLRHWEAPSGQIGRE